MPAGLPESGFQITTPLELYPFLPRYSPELNPDEQVWYAIKGHHLGRQSIKNKQELKSHAA